MILALTIISAIGIYSAIGTTVAVKSFFVYDESRNIHDASFAAGLSGVFWPIGLWVLLAVTLIDRGSKRRNEQDRINEEIRRERDRLLAAARKELDQLPVLGGGVPIVYQLNDQFEVDAVKHPDGTITGLGRARRRLG